MPERIDRISVATSRSTMQLPWSSREALLAELGDADTNAAIVKAFTDVGATRPVWLSGEGRARLYELLNVWAYRETVEKLPEGIWRLRNAIGEDLARGPGSGVGGLA